MSPIIANNPVHSRTKCNLLGSFTAAGRPWNGSQSLEYRIGENRWKRAPEESESLDPSHPGSKYGEMTLSPDLSWTEEWVIKGELVE